MSAPRILSALFRPSSSRTFTSTATSTFRSQPSYRPRPSTQWRTNPSSSRSYRRQAFNYQRFSTTKSYLRAWSQRPTFYYEVGGLGATCGGFYIYNLEPVAVTGRRRFNVVSPGREAEMGLQMYNQSLQEFSSKLLPAHSSEHRMVSRVLERLIPHSGLSDEENKWELHVVDDPTPNAFVIPGGKVFVFRGILDIARGEDGLAAVLGHEIAHNVAHHAAERMSRSFIILPFAVIGSLIVGLDVGIGNGLAKLAFELPGSRKEESEADYIGLLMMAQACFDPKAAIGLWQRMESMEGKQGGAPPAFLSTHPSSHDRGEKIRGWLGKAEEVYQRGECGGMGGYMSGFKEVTDFSRWS
ncbi:unnamed protein product [Zymoseptoria tritici ST99CH_3D1]|uniref:Peptidase M48 domain-containing protein n=1 Tax=Zymoseptoria tritici (strain ST99CH_3D7) TaxID=1276538 RepID=A0A1X7RND4_ZYMT9|nr:unnamed protein product [Zymoseptoria tritici ST99CH_3D7]SMR49942.1 unnamed protein product [Zymoseptoria tritici ST99CH_3D1]